MATPSGAVAEGAGHALDVADTDVAGVVIDGLAVVVEAAVEEIDP